MQLNKNNLFNIIIILNKLFLFSNLLKINIFTLLLDILLFVKKKIKKKIIIIFSYLLKIKIKNNYLLNKYKLINKNKIKKLFYFYLFKIIYLFNKYNNYKINKNILLSKFLHKWFVKKIKKKQKKQIFKYNSFFLINKISRFSIFKKFRLKYKKNKKYIKNKKWKKKNIFFYKKRKLIKSKYCWGHVGRLYKYNDNARVKHYIFNLKKDLSNAGLHHFSKNKLFNNYFFLYKFKNIMNYLLLNLSLIINFLLRKCVFKLFLGLNNVLCFYDFKIILYKLIFLFYDKRNVLLKRNCSQKIIKNYFLRTISLKLYYIN